MRCFILTAVFIALSSVILSAQAPLNDNCSGALEITPAATVGCAFNGTVIANNTGATQSLPGCTGVAEDDIWFTFVATAVRHNVHLTAFAAINPVIELFSGSCSSLTSLGCFSNPADLYTYLDQEFSGLVPGQRYYFRAYGQAANNARAMIQACMSTLPNPPANDECSGAIQVPVNPAGDPAYSYRGTVANASQSMPSCLDIRTAAKDVWFKFVATAADLRVVVAPDHSTEDYAFQVFSGSCSNLSPIACSNTGYYREIDTALLKNLTVGQTYYLRVYDYHGLAAASQTFQLLIGRQNEIITPGAGMGLKAEYFNNTTLSGTPILTRVDTSINFELTYAHPPLSPAPGIVPADNYSVRWTGKLVPLLTDAYHFTTVSDDGIRLWLNGILIIDNWKNQGTTTTESKTINLIAGKVYDIKVEYFEGTGEAVTKLYWNPGNYPKQIIPKQIMFPADPASPQLPDCVLNASPAHESILATATSATLRWRQAANALSYDVYIITGPDTAFLPIANVADTTYTAIGLTPSTTYLWYVEPRNANGATSVCGVTRTSFQTAAAGQPQTGGTGLKGVYFNGVNLSGTPLLTRIDTTINFELTYAHQPLTPAPGVVPEDQYSVRWTGKIQPQYSENYTFYTLSDDGIRLWINGEPLVDNWVNQGATEKTATISLAAGQKYDIVIEYFENTGEGITKLYWSSASTPKQIVPKSALYPDDPVPAGSGLQGVYYAGIDLSGAPLLTRIDPTINFELTYAHQPLSPAPGVVPDDLYSVRWTGQVQAQYSETYTFYTLADDGIRLWVNGQLLVDNWVNQGATENSGTISLIAGQKYDIKIEYYENSGEAVTKLFWSSPSTPKQIVPKSQLYPAAAGARIMASVPVNTSTTGMATAIVTDAVLSPNPVKPGLYTRIQLLADKPADAMLRITSLSGRTINSQQLKLVKGLNKKEINTMGLAQGMYIITISGNGKPVNLKLLIE